jgi:hypothetical protein
MRSRSRKTKGKRGKWRLAPIGANGTVHLGDKGKGLPHRTTSFSDSVGEKHGYIADGAGKPKLIAHVRIEIDHGPHRAGLRFGLDCVAGHIGFELRCAERKFISLNTRQCSRFEPSAETVPPFWRIFFCLNRIARGPAGALVRHHGKFSRLIHRSLNPPRGADRIQTAAEFAFERFLSNCSD